MHERFEKFTVSIMNINRQIHKIKAEEMAEFDLKSPHVSCLYYLYESERLTAKGLCDLCAEDKSSVSRSIEYLETNGYVACDSNAKKRYNAALTLTDKGKEVGARIAEKVDRIMESAGAGLSDLDRAVLYRSLARIENNLKEICKKYGE